MNSHTKDVIPGRGPGTHPPGRRTSAPLRHPEKANRPDTDSPRHPAWLRVKLHAASAIEETQDIISRHRLNTVCNEAACPNLNECWSKRHATFLIMGPICTRACAFCNVATGRPDALDKTEPPRVARAVKDLALKHVVITSVDRDDLNDGGAAHFADVISAIRQHTNAQAAKQPAPTIEILVPDFRRKPGALETVLAASPDVFNHNLETVPGLYPTIRPGARYFHSLQLLQRAKELDPAVFTKSGLMVGLGETNDQIIQVMDDLRTANVDFLTIGQYLRPTKKHAAIKRFVPPDEFDSLKQIAQGKGFLLVAASPFTRSSYHADRDFNRLRTARNAKQNIRSQDEI